MKYEIIVLIESENKVKEIIDYFKDDSSTIKHAVFNNHKLDQPIGKINQCSIFFIQIECNTKIVVSDISIPCLRFLVYKVDSFVPLNAVSSWFNIENNIENKENE